MRDTKSPKKKGGVAVGGTIRARVSHGLLEPLETVVLPEGKEVTITILDLPTERDVEASRCAAGGWRGLVDAETLIRNIYADRLISTRPDPRL
jgi:predicted DNA-binding antitoxin AbrB/MazE fold protein